MNEQQRGLLGRATDLVRRGDPLAATRAIREALGGAAPSGAADPSADPSPGTPSGASSDASFGTCPDPFGGASTSRGGSLREMLRAAAAAARPGTGPIRAPSRPAGPAGRGAADAGSEGVASSTGGRVVRGTFSSRLGTRDWRLYVPTAAAKGEPLPLVVMLHGCTQDADDFARGTRMDAVAEAAGAFALYPEQSSKANPQRCWNWFKPNHQDLARGEPAIVAGMLAQVGAEHRIDTARLFAAGLSAGGAMAAILGAAGNTPFAGIAVHSGLGAGAASDVPSAFAAMQGQGADVRGARVPTIVFQGDADRTVAPVNAERLVEACVRAGPGTLRRAVPVRANGRECERVTWSAPDGAVACESWTIRGAGHAWSGGDPSGSYADATGPDASALMMDFFLACAAAKSRAA